MDFVRLHDFAKKEVKYYVSDLSHIDILEAALVFICLLVNTKWARSRGIVTTVLL